MKSNILGQSYQTVEAFACNQMINLFLETAPSDSKSPGVLLRAHGMTPYASNPFGTSTGCEVRGAWKASNGVAFWVIKNKLYAALLGVLTLIGTLNTSNGLVVMRDNGLQLIIVDGTAGYIVTLSTNVFAIITDANFPNGCTTIAYIDTVFLAGIPNTQEYRISSQMDGTVWAALDWAAAEGDPDNLLAVIESHRELKLFGVRTTETAVDSGDPSFPFSRPGGAIIDHGIAAVHSAQKANNTVVFLGQDDKGAGLVYEITGLSTSSIISTRAIEYAISKWARMDDAFAIVFQDRGHECYMLTSPSAGETWVMDFSTKEWHQRASFSEGVFSRHRANCHMFHEGKHLVGDYDNGNIYEYSMNVFADDSSEQKWVRTWREIGNERKNVIFHKIEIDAQMGVGLDGSVQGSDALCMLEYSDDGGRTFNQPIQGTFGKIGEYLNRCEFWDLGDSPDRVWRLSGTDPNMIALCAAYVEMTPCG